MKLNAKQVEQFKKRPGRYGDGHGLYLQVVSPTNASWQFRYERAGRERWMGLGPLHTLSLTEARDRARTARLQLIDGVDPIDARKSARSEAALNQSQYITFAECADAFFKATADRWKNEKHRAQFTSTLKTYVNPIIGDLPVRAIEVAHILKILEQEVATKDRKAITTFWRARTETASRVRQRIEKVLDWAKVRGFRTGDNPARWKGFLSTQVPARGGNFAPVRHHPALPYDQLPAIMKELSARQGVAARALEFFILTTSRPGAVIGAQWDEIDFENKVWTVPAKRAGTKIYGVKARRIPLSDQAITLLKSLPRERGNSHVFIGLRAGGSLSNMAMLQQLKRMGRDDVTVHGFRSTFKDWATETRNYPNHLSEAALWHAVADKVEAAYRRGDLFEKRRRMMDDWAKYCARCDQGQDVSYLRRAV